MFFIFQIILFLFISTNYVNAQISDQEICKKIFYSNMHQVDKFIALAKERDLSCGIKQKNSQNIILENNNKKNKKTNKQASFSGSGFFNGTNWFVFVNIPTTIPSSITLHSG